MKFNARGDLGAGIGTVVTVNRQPVPMPGPRPGFFQCWRDDDTILVNASAEPLVSALPEDKVPFHLYQHRRVTGWQPELFDERGATLAHGGAGNFAAYLAAKPAFVSYGVFNGVPFDSQQPAINRFPWILLDGANDGRLLFATPDGGTLKYLETDGTVRSFPVGPHVEGVNIRLADGGLVYYDEARPKTLILQHADGPVEAFACVDTPFEPTCFLFAGRRWALYHNDATYLQLLGTTRGYRFAGSYSPTLHIEADGTAHVALTSSPGEAPETITLVPPFVLGQGTVNLAAAPPTFEPFTHPVLVMPFKDPAGESGAPAEVVVNQGRQSVARPYVVVDDSLAGPFLGERLGIYTEDPIRARLLCEAHPETRVVYGHDAPTAPLVPVTRPWDQVWLELYLVVGESLIDTVERWTANMRALLASWPGDVGVVPELYSQGGAPPNEQWSVQDVLNAFVHVPTIVNLSPRIKIVAPFAWLRANGITAHPEYQAAFRQLLAASPGLPTFTPIGAAPAPRPVPAPRPTPVPKPVPTPVPAPSPDDPEGVLMSVSKRGFLRDLATGQYAAVDPSHPTVLWLHDPPNPPDHVNGGGWEEVEVSDPLPNKARHLQFRDAKVFASLDSGGVLTARPAPGGGDEEWILAMQPPDFGFAFAWTQHVAGQFLAKTSVPRVFIFEPITNAS